MKWNASPKALALFLAAIAGGAPFSAVAGQDAIVDPAAGFDGPRGSSQGRPGEVRHDETGFAAIDPALGSGMAAAHATLAPDTLVELTALADGRTLLVRVAETRDPGRGRVVALGPAVAAALGDTGAGPLAVRLRRVAVPPAERAAVRAGQVVRRADAPAILLTALRKRLPPEPASEPAAPAPKETPGRAAAPLPRPMAVRQGPTRPAAAAPRPASGRFVVQVAALSDARRAQALAQRMGGFVKQGGGFHRVQLGPFATRGAAEAARAGAARAGYADARVIAAN